MRSNHPVSQTEYRLRPGQNLVSTTDLKGRILHCNPAFVEASGFTREELQGQPHNMIRHPDMPPEAFRDMWDTISQGRPWSGLVKNRRKNGDFYWVQANVTPLMEDDQPVAYTSVRSCPDRAAVERAQALYDAINQDAQQAMAPRVRLHRGRVLRTGLAGRVQALGQVFATHRPALLFVLPVLLACGLSAATRSPAWSLAAGLVAALACHLRVKTLCDRSVAELLRFAQRMAAGDLTQRSDRTAAGCLASCSWR